MSFPDKPAAVLSVVRSVQPKTAIAKKLMIIEIQ